MSAGATQGIKWPIQPASGEDLRWGWGNTWWAHRLPKDSGDHWWHYRKVGLMLNDLIFRRSHKPRFLYMKSSKLVNVSLNFLNSVQVFLGICTVFKCQLFKINKIILLNMSANKGLVLQLSVCSLSFQQWANYRRHVHTDTHTYFKTSRVRSSYTTNGSKIKIKRYYVQHYSQ